MTSRRSFLLGIGALVSVSFVTRVKAHVLESARPLLLEPKRAEETLCDARLSVADQSAACLSSACRRA